MNLQFSGSEVYEMVWIASVIGGWIVLSAVVVVFLCMFSSRLSQAEGRVEDWSGHQVPAKATADRRLQGAPSRL